MYLLCLGFFEFYFHIFVENISLLFLFSDFFIYVCVMESLLFPFLKIRTKNKTNLTIYQNNVSIWTMYAYKCKTILCFWEKGYLKTNIPAYIAMDITRVTKKTKS